MSHGVDLYIISYDISENRRRARVSKVLLGFGERVQESVFECFLDVAQRQMLRERLAKLIKPEEDNVRIYHLCERCGRRVEAIGAPPPVERRAYIL